MHKPSRTKKLTPAIKKLLGVHCSVTTVCREDFFHELEEYGEINGKSIGREKALEIALGITDDDLKYYASVIANGIMEAFNDAVSLICEEMLESESPEGE